MRKTVYKGILKTWKDNRGFGFIKPDNGDKDIFVHISSLKGMPRRPNRGDILYYEIAEDGDGKLKAINVCNDTTDRKLKSAKSMRRWIWLLALSLGLISIGVAAYFHQ